MSRDLGDSESGLGRARGQLTDCSSLLERKFFHWREAADRASDRPKLNFATAVPECISSPHKKKEEKTSKQACVRPASHLSEFASLTRMHSCLSVWIGRREATRRGPRHQSAFLLHATHSTEHTRTQSICATGPANYHFGMRQRYGYSSGTPENISVTR